MIASLCAAGHTDLRMSLSAWVSCDCYETGKMKTPPPQPELVFLDPETGAVHLQWEEQGADSRGFHAWLQSACEHGPLAHLVSHHLGNIARIRFIRELFEQTPERFPTLLSKVVYNGVHDGILSLREVEDVAHELLAVRALHCSDPVCEEVVREFEVQMSELVEASRKVHKPIVF